MVESRISIKLHVNNYVLAGNRSNPDINGEMQSSGMSLGCTQSVKSSFTVSTEIQILQKQSIISGVLNKVNKVQLLLHMKCISMKLHLFLNAKYSSPYLKSRIYCTVLQKWHKMVLEQKIFSSLKCPQNGLSFLVLNYKMVATWHPYPH